MTEHPSIEGFAPITKTEWLEKIKKDLRGNSADSLSWQIDQRISMSPFQHADDVVHSMRLPSRSQPLIGGYIYINRIEPTTNQQLLSLLAHGVNAVSIQADHAINLPDWHRLFAGVQLPYIHFTLSSSDFDKLIENFLEWDQYVTTMGYTKSELQGSLVYSGEQRRLVPLFKKWHAIFPQFSFFTIVESDHADDESKVLANTGLLSNTISILELFPSEMYSSLLTKLRWELRSSNLYFIEVARLRALHWNWALLLESWGLASYLSPHIHYTVDVAMHPNEKALIAATTQSLAAYQGGIDQLQIHFDGTSDYSRLGWNIQHLLQLESQLGTVQDPACGSYYLENLTEKIARASWELLS